MIEILVEVVFRAICFPIGWPLMRLITLGKYPSKGSRFSYTPESEWTSALGLAVLAINMMAVLRQFVFT
ncbi:hypothetical protein EIG75_20245 [Pseudomonas syringae]|uniref:Uncharacterized protein n=1 Tax=Pseudomonas syringae TaxID=317 RepID=A0A6B2AZL2_PSESX|nr:hypothetical protein [Pseudomonas syringae]MDC6491268.1 hypothetical protein [Pseudomonas syringae]MDC6496006.1 hypothetical protein [Pseudomonas syringae]MDC6501035.1 hypothetical protein [Pseudomonas syringae]MDC6511675.1 hypothetical protein [Pseudomonas syringae]MDC6527310.1 hypothetical protein [Pseudomonas syringae]